jgi:hypothetical protein
MISAVVSMEDRHYGVEDGINLLATSDSRAENIEHRFLNSRTFQNCEYKFERIVQKRGNDRDANGRALFKFILVSK